MGHNGTIQPALCLPSPASPYLLQKGTLGGVGGGERSELENSVSVPVAGGFSDLSSY